MHRRRPGRHAHRVCLPVTTALLGLALAAGCSSGGAGPSTPPATSQQPVRTPPTTAGPTPVGLPVSPSPTPTKRTLTRPAGATINSVSICTAPTNVVILWLQQRFFAAPDLTQQLIELKGAGQLAASERRHIEKARRVWLRHGYPASFPMVRELDSYIDIYNKIIAAAKARSVDPVPNLYLRLEKVDTQYSSDTGISSVCEQ